MGLDLVVEGCARAGHEAEWRKLLELSFDGEEPDEGDVDRFAQITIPAYERIGAPRVGHDKAADDWMIAARNATTPEEIAAVLKEAEGYYVLSLVDCDGIPKFTHAGLYEGVDETSFRGAFLSACEEVLSTELIDEAWGHKFPEEAIQYGKALLAAASAAASGAGPPQRGLLSRIFGSRKKPSGQIPRDEQVEIVTAAGKWFIFWGERGHAIRAWF